MTAVTIGVKGYYVEANGVKYAFYETTDLWGIDLISQDHTESDAHFWCQMDSTRR